MHILRSTHWKKARPWIGAVLIAAALGVAAFLLWRALRDYSLDDILAAVASIPVTHLAAAVGFAAASYLCLTAFDYLALRHVGRPIRYRFVALASFVSLSIGHNIGFAGLSSGAIRYRFYSHRGATAAEVAQVIVFCGMTVAVGLATLGGAAILLRPTLAGEVVGIGQAGIVALEFGRGWPLSSRFKLTGQLDRHVGRVAANGNCEAGRGGICVVIGDQRDEFAINSRVDDHSHGMRARHAAITQFKRRQRERAVGLTDLARGRPTVSWLNPHKPHHAGQWLAIHQHLPCGGRDGWPAIATPCQNDSDTGSHTRRPAAAQGTRSHHERMTSSRQKEPQRLRRFTRRPQQEK